MHHDIDHLWDELLTLAATMHWALDDVLDLEHRDRTRVVAHLASAGDA